MLFTFRLLISTALSIFIAVGTYSQSASNLSVADQKKLAEKTLINNLIFDARSQSPEIAADALITIAESTRIISAKQKRSILEEAFNLAAQAQYPVRIRYAGFTDNRVWSTYNPLDLKLDKLSLRSRVIKALLKFDKTRARKLFLDEMPPEMDLPSLGCEDAVRYYDVSDYYTTASMVFDTTFTPKERSEPTFFYVLLPFIDHLNSPAQVGPAAKMLVDLKLSPSQLTLAAASYSQVIGKIKNDDFSFRTSMSNTGGVNALIKAITVTRLGNAQQIVNGFREYVLKQLNGTRCSDGVKKNVTNPLVSKYELPGYIKTVNQDILKDKPIDPQEVEPENIVKTTRPPDYWEDTTASSERLDAGRKLRFKGEGQVFSNEEKLGPDWQTMLDKYLLDLGNWEAEEEKSPEDYFNKKSIVFLSLLDETVPKGRGWNAVLREFVLFLSRNELRGESRLQWFWHVRYLTRMAERGTIEDRAKMKSVVESSNNPTLKLQFDLLNFESKPLTP